MRKYLIFCLLLLALLPATVSGQERISDDEVNDVAKDLYCPVCESTPLDVCPTQACADWRELIRTKLAAGESRQDVLEYFARQYGDGVLANPPRRGISLIILWVLPVLLVALGGLLFFRLLRGMRTAVPATTAPAVARPPVTSPAVRQSPGDAPRDVPPDDASSDDASLDAYIARVERDLKQ